MRDFAHLFCQACLIQEPELAQKSIKEKASEGMLMMPANKPHALDSITRFKMSLIMIKA